MPCVCQHKLAALANPSFVASLNATLSAVGVLPLPPLPNLPALHLALKHQSLPPPGPYSDSLLLAVQQLQLPRIGLVAALPTLGSLINLAFICKEQLGLPLTLPNVPLKLAAMLRSFLPSLLAPLLALDMAVLASLQAHAALVLQIRALLKVDPLDINASAQLSEVLGSPSNPIRIALTVPMPELPPGLVVKLGEISALHPLITLAMVVGIDLRLPNALAELAAWIRSLIQSLLQVALPHVVVSLDLIARITALAQIHAAFGLFNSNLATLRSQIRLLTSLKLAVHLPAILPPVDLKLGQHLPTAQQVQDVLALNLPQLAAINWQVPVKLPLLDLIPVLALIAQLKSLGPILQLTPCAASCPLGGPGQLI